MRALVARIIVVAAACVVAAGCGSEADDSTEAAETVEPATTAGTGDSAGGEEVAGASADEQTYPVAVETAAGPVLIEARPERIVSLSPTATEMLFAIGAGEQVIAVDSLSTYPSGAPVTDLSAFEPNLEAIAANEPDLVVLGIDDETVTAGLADIGVPVLVHAAAATLDDAYDQVAQLGEATGNVDAAAELNAEIRSGIDEVVTAATDAAATTGGSVRVYHELDETFYSVSSASFIGQLYSLLGYENIADEADPDGTGYPQLQVEQIIAADPTLIVYTDAYGYGDEEIAARPGWDAITAVDTGNIVQVDDDVASRWGPRTVDFLRAVVEASTGALTG